MSKCVLFKDVAVCAVLSGKSAEHKETFAKSDEQLYDIVQNTFIWR